MDVSFERPEAALVRQILETHLADLRQQISHTDTSTMRDRLGLERDLVEQILPKFQGVTEDDLPW
jgi:hypothetical protein